MPGRLELHAFGRFDRFASATASWNRILEDISALDVDHVLFTGDLTAMGDEHEFLAIHDSLLHLLREKRLTVIPGNHDRYTDAPEARHFERLFGQHLASDLPEYADAHGYPFVRLLGNDTAVVGLDSTRVTGWSQYVVGRLGAPQLQALQRVLDDPRVAGRTVHVLSHHGPLSPDGRREWRESALIDGPELLAVLADRPVMLHHGHSHVRSWQRASAGAHLFGGGSSTEPGRDGYWMLDVDDHQRFEAAHFKPGRERVAHPRG